MKDYKCKCSHSKSKHTRFTGLCHECACTNMERTTDNNSPLKAGVISLVILMGMYVGLMAYISFDINEELTTGSDFLKETIEIPFQLIFTLGLIGMIVLSIILGCISSILIYSYYKTTRRTDYNEEILF